MFSQVLISFIMQYDVTKIPKFSFLRQVQWHGIFYIVFSKVFGSASYLCLSNKSHTILPGVLFQIIYLTAVNTMRI